MTSPVAATVGPAGISAPNFATIFNYLVTQFQAIYGVDSYLGNDSQDGQLLGTFAQAISDCNSAAVAVYNSFSPTTAVGNGLSSNIKINGLTRIVGSFSTAVLTAVGVANTTLNNAQAQDSSGNVWALPATVTIPSSGTVNVTAICTTLGAIAAAPNTINVIGTPILNWQTVNNSGAAVPGNPVETDAAVRVRQANSVALPSVSVFVGIEASIAQVLGVSRVTAYENNTASVNGIGLNPNTLCFVVEGGTTAAIGNAIALKIPPGIGTFGNVGFTYVDPLGTSRVISYQTPNPTSTAAAIITVHTLTGWASSTAAVIIQAVATYIDTVPIGGVVNVASVTSAALLLGTALASTFLIKSVQINKNGGGGQSTDLVLAAFESVSAGISTVTTV